MQSRDTKNVNMDKDLGETPCKNEQTGWNELTKTEILHARRRKRSKAVVVLDSATEGEHSLLRNRLGLREGDEGAYADFHDGKGRAI